MIPEPTLLITLLLLWFFVALLLSPLEALSWWAGWYEGDEEDHQVIDVDPQTILPEDITGYLVYLTGISGVSGEVFLEEENDLLRRLDATLTDVIVVDDVYPYSVSNQALTGQRVFARFWRFALQMKLSGKPLQRVIGFIINLRNAFQIMVSADRRYGPIYNFGSAQLIARALMKHGYERGSHIPIILLAYSGGGQIAVGAVPYLKKMIDAPITVISLGGAISADPGVVEVEHLYHLYGKRDGVQRLGLLLSPSRWRIGELKVLPRSRWNRARHAGKMTFIYMGDMKHNGKGGYLDDEVSVQSDGRSNMVMTVETIARLAQQALSIHTKQAA